MKKQQIYWNRINKYKSIEKELLNEIYNQNKPANIDQIRVLERYQKLIMSYQNMFIKCK
jgi:hypothetical protein